MAIKVTATETVAPARRLELLRHVPAFAALPSAALQGLAAALHEEHYPAGAVVLAADTEAHPLYLIAQGRAEVSVRGPSGPVPLALLHEGELCGELALLSPAQHQELAVTALTPLRVLALAAPACADLLQTYLAVRAALEREDETLLVAAFLKLASPFSKLDATHVQRLAAHLAEQEAPAGTIIVRQGEPGEACYLVRAGHVELLAAAGAAAEGDGVPARHLATLGPGALFGEDTLLAAAPHTATARASEDCRLLVLRRADLLDAMGADRQVAAGIVELMRLRDERPRQVPGVEQYSRMRHDGTTVTILKDPRRGAYYRLSPEGLFLWQRLDGQHSLRDLTLDYLAAFKQFAPAVLAEVVGGLAMAGFVETPALRPDVIREMVHLSRVQRATLLARRALEWRAAVGHADAPLGRLYRAVRFLFTRPGQAGLALLSGLGLAAFLLVSARAGATLERVGGLLWFLIPAYLLSIVVHELGHALTTKAFGREVPRVGVGWYWFGPVAFVDTSDMWLAARWPRIAVSLAGPYANALLAAVAALAALVAGGTVATAVLWQFALASYAGVLLNLNPLLEYDGYYVLMDLVDRPNLRVHCLGFLGRAFPAALRHPGLLRGHRLEVLFGVASLVYVAAMAGVTVVVYRLFVQGWLAQLIPGVLAAALAWVLAGVVVALSLLTVAGGLRAPARGHT